MRMHLNLSEFSGVESLSFSWTLKAISESAPVAGNRTVRNQTSVFANAVAARLVSPAVRICPSSLTSLASAPPRQRKVTRRSWSSPGTGSTSGVLP